MLQPVVLRVPNLAPRRSILVVQVDNLGTGTLHSQHVDISSTVLCFCTSRFFTSGPCAQEVVRAVVQRKPLIALLDTDRTNGGLTELECRHIFEANSEWAVEVKPRIGKISDRLAKWKTDWALPNLSMPTSSDIEAALFASPPIVWSRLSAFQEYDGEPRTPHTSPFGAAVVAHGRRLLPDGCVCCNPSVAVYRCACLLSAACLEVRDC